MLRKKTYQVILTTLLVSSIQLFAQGVEAGINANYTWPWEAKSRAGTSLVLDFFDVRIIKDGEVVRMLKTETMVLLGADAFEGFESGTYTISVRAWAKDWANNPSDWSGELEVLFNADRPIAIPKIEIRGHLIIEIR